MMLTPTHLCLLQWLTPKQEELLSSLGLDVTVTRREDATFAPNGYIYNVYFDGTAQARTTSIYHLSACLHVLFL